MSTTLVVPYCVYYKDGKIDEEAIVMYGFDGCLPEINDMSVWGYHKPGRWVLGAKFFGVLPIIRPISRGMIGISFRQSGDVILLKDPYNIEQKSVVFLTYANKQPYTAEMRIWKHKTKKDIYSITFRDQILSSDNWHEPSYSSVFVMYDFYTYRGKKMKNPDWDKLSFYDKFKCEDGICIPSTTGTNFDKCHTPCMIEWFSQESYWIFYLTLLIVIVLLLLVFLYFKK